MKLNLNVDTKTVNNKVSFCGKNDIEWLEKFARFLWESIQEYHRIKRKLSYVGLILQQAGKALDWLAFVNNNYETIFELTFEEVYYEKDGKKYRKYAPRENGIDNVYNLLVKNGLLAETK